MCRSFQFIIHLCGIGAGHRLRDLGDLITGSDDALAFRVVDVGHVLVLKLSPLPDLDLATSTKDTDAHGREQVVGGVGVEVDTTVEDSSGVLANGRRDEGLATGVVLDEVCDVVDDTGDSNESLAILRLLNKVVPTDDGKLL